MAGSLILCDGSGERKYGWPCPGCLNCQGEGVDR